MKQRTFVIFMLVLVLILAAMLAAVWNLMFGRSAAEPEPVALEETAPPIAVEEVEKSDRQGIWWEDPRIEVGTLTYTITRTDVVQNITHAGNGVLREGAAIYMYTPGQEEPIPYFYMGNVESQSSVVDHNGNLVPGSCMVVLDIQVESVDAVNFVTDPETGIQDRRYEDNPFLFRADEVCYLIDTGDDSHGGYTYYDAVFFNAVGDFAEHPMAYELLPGESTTFRIGFLMGNRRNGSARNLADLVVSTAWQSEQEQYFDLNLG